MVGHVASAKLKLIRYRPELRSYKMKFSTALASTVIGGMLLFSATVATAQQAYPNKPIRLIVPNPPGGGVDIMARMVGQRLSESWGQPVIVENRAGANGFIGGEALARSSPDGYTIGLITSTHIISPLLFPAPYDSLKDFTPVASIACAEQVLVIHPSVPANNLRELIALAKSKPGQLNIGSGGAGSMPRLASALFDMMTGTTIQNISYKGTPQTMQDLLGGQIQLSFSLPAAAIPHIRSGKLKAIAVSGETRMPGLPQVPTFTEVGLPNFKIENWYGFLAPAGTPDAIVNSLSSEIGKISGIPAVIEQIRSHGMEPFTSNAAQFAALMKNDIAKFANIIKTANIKAD